MSFRSQKIFEKIMENAVKSVEPDTPTQRQRFHVSQTADQLPDIRQRNAFYRAELEKQIFEKKEAERKRKEREALEEERLLRRIEADREKIKGEYIEEIRQREMMQEEAIRKQQAIARKLEEIHEAEERKREAELLRRRQEVAAKRMQELEEAVEKKRAEEIEKRRLAAWERYHYRSYSGRDLLRNGWNSRDYVNSALGIEGAVGGVVSIRKSESCYNGSLEDVYYSAPLSVLAEVYRRLVFEKTRIKDIIKERISDGEG